MRIISGKYGRRRFDVPTNITARPTTDFARENIFNVIENIIDLEGIRALDLFAGTGAITFELLSRGAASVTSVEKALTQFNFIRKVGSLLNDPNLHAVKGDVRRFLASAPAKGYDLVFADPPYDMPDFDKVAATVLESDIIAEDGWFILEHNKTKDYSSHPWFAERRVYGSVNFSLFHRPAQESDSL